MEKIKLTNESVFDVLAIDENNIKEILTITIPIGNKTVEDIEKTFSNEELVSTIKLLTAADEFMSSYRGYIVLGNTTKSNYTYSESVEENTVIQTVPALTLKMEKQSLSKIVETIQTDLVTANEIINTLLVTTLKTIE